MNIASKKKQIVLPQFNKNASDDYYDENDDAFVDGMRLA